MAFGSRPKDRWVGSTFGVVICCFVTRYTSSYSAGSISRGGVRVSIEALYPQHFYKIHYRWFAVIDIPLRVRLRPGLYDSNLPVSS